MSYLRSVHSIFLTALLSVLFAAPAASQTDASDWACTIADPTISSTKLRDQGVRYRVYTVDEEIASAVSKAEALDVLMSLPTNRPPDQFMKTGVKLANEVARRWEEIPYDQLAFSLVGGFSETEEFWRSRNIDQGFRTYSMLYLERFARKGSVCLMARFEFPGKGKAGSIEALNKASGVATALLARGARQIKPEMMLQRLNLSRLSMIDPILRKHPNLRSVLEANRIRGWSAYAPGLLPGLDTLEETEAYDTTKVR